MDIKRCFRTYVVVSVCGYMLASTAFAMDCDDDSLSDVSGSGAILEMISGHIYKVNDADQVDSSLWLTAEDVLVCSKGVTYQGKNMAILTVINKDEDGEEVMVERLK